MKFCQGVSAMLGPPLAGLLVEAVGKQGPALQVLTFFVIWNFSSPLLLLFVAPAPSGQDSCILRYGINFTTHLHFNHFTHQLSGAVLFTASGGFLLAYRYPYKLPPPPPLPPNYLLFQEIIALCFYSFILFCVNQDGAEAQKLSNAVKFLPFPLVIF